MSCKLKDQKKKPAPQGAGFQAMKKLLAGTDVRFVVLEG